jgi:hypothetical protein
MASLEERLSGSASAKSQLHAFSLSSSGRDGQAGSAGGLGWRQSFGEQWDEIALGDLVGRHADPRSVGIRAKRHFELVERDLLALWKGPGAGRCSVLRCAAVSLECSAGVWQAFGPVAGGRHLHLLHRLEETLAVAERQIRAAELPRLVNRPTISVSVRAASAAIDDLLSATVDPADALAALEDAAVGLASLAVRIASDLNETGNPRRAHAMRSVALGRQLEVLLCEVSSSTYARRSVREGDAERDHLGVWLAETLSVVPPAGAIELTSLSSGDPCLSADGFFSLRARWLELAVGLWAIVKALDDLSVVVTFDDEERLKRAVSSRVGSALVACGLYERPGDFDHRQAWDRQREALNELVSEVCRALQSGDSDAVLCSQQLALRRLTRALVAVWVIDERMRSPVQRARRPCP